MKVFSNAEKAVESMRGKKKYYLNSICPYDSGRLCGSRCALFYIAPAVSTEEQNTSAYVILGCKAGEKNLHVSEFVED